MTASPRSRRYLAAALAFGAPVVGVVLGACSSSSPPLATGVTPGIDSGIVHLDATVGPTPDASDGGEPDTSFDAADSSPPDFADAADAADSAPFDAGWDAGPPICNLDASVGSPTFLIGLADPSILGGITSDELVIAWTSVPDGGSPVVQWAERASTADTFGAAQTLDSSFGPFPADKVSIKDDGLRLAFASADETQIIELTRSARGTPFGTVTTNTHFVGVNPIPGPEGTPGIGPFQSPALSPHFTYWAFVQGANGLVNTTSIGFGEWSTPPRLPVGLAPAFASSSTTIAPTAWSSDDRTLFYWDAFFGKAMMAWRDPYTSEIFTAESIGTLRNAVPSGNCSNIYFSGALGIFVAPRQ